MSAHRGTVPFSVSSHSISHLHPFPSAEPFSSRRTSKPPLDLFPLDFVLVPPHYQLATSNPFFLIQPGPQFSPSRHEYFQRRSPFPRTPLQSLLPPSEFMTAYRSKFAPILSPLRLFPSWEASFRFTASRILEIARQSFGNQRGFASQFTPRPILSSACRCPIVSPFFLSRVTFEVLVRRAASAMQPATALCLVRANPFPRHRVFTSTNCPAQSIFSIRFVRCSCFPGRRGFAFLMRSICPR